MEIIPLQDSSSELLRLTSFAVVSPAVRMLSFILHTFSMSSKSLHWFWSDGFKDCFLKVIKKVLSLGDFRKTFRNRNVKKKKKSGSLQTVVFEKKLICMLYNSIKLYIGLKILWYNPIKSNRIWNFKHLFFN